MLAKDRLLFLRYALPCAGTLVKRGNVSQERVDELIRMVASNDAPKYDAEDIFKIAEAMCDAIRERMGKSDVDSQVIRQYFLLEHSDVVDDRYNLMGDFDPVSCKTRMGRVITIGADHAIVETSLGKSQYRTEFARDLKPGDNVVVHWDFIVEIVPRDFAKLVGVETDEKRE